MFYFGSLFVLSIIVLVKTQEWTKLNCPAPRSPENGVSFIFEDGLKVQYRCHPGFIMRGKPLSVCRYNKWDSPPPYCDPTETYEDPMSTSDKIAVTTFRNRFNWEPNDMKQNHISIRYGNGSSRLPLINGLWKHPSTNIDSPVLTIVPDSSLGHSVPPKQLINQEMDIAALRKKLEQEIKSSRQINDKNEFEKKLNPSHYPPLYANADGFVLGISNSNRHPVYHLGALADYDRNNYYTPRYLEPELAELRRKQIEETRNIQMSTANRRQQDKFNNVVMYSSRDIPVWQGRIKPKNRYQTEKTMYKPNRVERNKPIDQNSLNFQKSTARPASFYMRTVNFPKASSQKAYQEKLSTEIPNIFKTNTIPLLTENIMIATMSTPISEPFKLDMKKNNFAALPQTLTSDSTNKTTELNVNNKQESLEWPPEALWFKYTTLKPVFTKPIITYRPQASQRPQKTRKRASNKKSNRKSSRGKSRRKSQEAPVVIFSHGRVKSTNPKKAKQ